MDANDHKIIIGFHGLTRWHVPMPSTCSVKNPFSYFGLSHLMHLMHSLFIRLFDIFFNMFISLKK